MTFIPNAEHIILEVKRSFFGEPPKPSIKRRFNYRELSLEKQVELFDDGIDKIFQSLEFDTSAKSDATLNLLNLVQASYPIELRTMTFGASQSQILWEFLTHIYVPGLARLAAFWTLDSRADIGMPDHEFWYLPNLNRLNPDKLTLPVPQVLDWLLDLYGQPVHQMACDIDSSVENKVDTIEREDKVDKIERDINRWRTGNTIPKKESIDIVFSDENKIKFRNIFQANKHDNLETQVQKAIEFLKSKETLETFSAEKISLDFDPRGRDRIQQLLNGEASDEYKEYFVARVARRYTAPLAKSVRQRLHFARAVQDGYIRLLKFLCPEVAANCADPNVNRVIELIDIFKLVYNRTIDAHVNSREVGDAAEDDYFRKSLPSHLCSTVLLSITPQDFLNGDADHLMIAEILSRRFAAMHEDSGLTTYLHRDEDALREIVLRETTIRLDLSEETEELLKLQTENTNRLTLDEIAHDQRVWLLFKIAHDDTLQSEYREAAANQLRRITADKRLEGLAIWMQLGLAHFQRQEQQVEKLLEDAEALLTDHNFGIWRAPICFLNSRYLLSKSKFSEARKSYENALKASKSQPFGALRGIIALELLAFKTHQNVFNKINDQSLLRDISYFDMAKGLSYKRDNLKRQLSPYWQKIYRPYAQ